MHRKKQNTRLCEIHNTKVITMNQSQSYKRFRSGTFCIFFPLPFWTSNADQKRSTSTACCRSKYAMRPFIFICRRQSYILERVNGTNPLARRIASNFEMEPRELACLISNLIMGEEGSTMFLKENILVSNLGMRKMYGKASIQARPFGKRQRIRS